MTPADSAIARRLRVQCERFGWMGGMLMRDGGHPKIAPFTQRLGEPDEDDPGRWWFSGWEISEKINDDVLPDPHDPATVGCFAAMARKATDPRAHVQPTTDGGWAAMTPHGHGAFWRHARCATEIEAWLAVLEATPSV